MIDNCKVHLEWPRPKYTNDEGINEIPPKKSLLYTCVALSEANKIFYN